MVKANYWGAMIMVLIVPFLVSSRFSFSAIFLSAIAVLFLVLGQYRSGLNIKLNSPNLLILAFLVFSLISLAFSIQIIRSWSEMVWTIVFVATFLFFQGPGREGKFIESLSKTLVIVVALASVYGIYEFIYLGLTSYTRLTGFLDSHNVYGGFLILPLVLSVYLFISREKKASVIFWFVTSILIISNFVLTFSRGSWLSLVLALFISIVLFRKNLKLVGKGKTIFYRFSGLILISVLLIIGVWNLAGWKSSFSNTSDITIYPLQNAETNAFTARLHYWDDARKTFLARPFSGFGPGNYALGLRMVKTDPAYASFADPHNWFLKILVERGLFAGLIFAVFLVWLFWRFIGALRRRDGGYGLDSVIFIGLLGGLIHGLMDFDWSLPGLTLIFMAFAGALSGKLLTHDGNRVMRVIVSYFLIILILGGVVLSIQTLRADLARAKGDVYFYSLNDPNRAIDSYFLSLTILSDARSWYSLWSTYFETGNYPVAKHCLDEALALYPESGSYYLARAVTNQTLGDMVNYRLDLLSAIRYFPANDLNPVARLVKLDYENGHIDEANYYVAHYLPLYEKYEKSLWYESDPNSTEISANLKRLKEFK